MIVKIQLIDDNGEVWYEADGPIQEPLGFKTRPDSPKISEGKYYIFGFTYQPIVKVIPKATP